MSKHTPGPWHYDERWKFVKTSDNEMLLVTGVAIPVGNHTRAKEAEANSRLIAAAPALLLACETALEHIEDGDLYRATMILRAAIAHVHKGATNER